MSNSVIYNKFRYTNLSRFMNSLVDDSNPLYLGIGRPYYWNTTLANDANIATTNNSVRNETLDWNDMMFMKRINYSDVSFGMVKTKWQAGFAYDQYRIDWDGTRISVYDGTYPTDISTSRSVVVNDANNVYVCLKHPAPTNPADPTSVPASLNSPETGVAIGTNTGILKTADNYYWKYIASTSSAAVANFSTQSTTLGFGATSFHPIATLYSAPSISDAVLYPQWQSQLLSAQYAGGIYAINVLSTGSGYNGGAAGTVSVTNPVTDPNFTVIGDGSGIQFNVTYGSGGTITDIEITNPGTGYSFATVTAYGGIGFNYEVIFTPRTGLGVDPAKDVDAVYLLVSTSLAGNEGGIFTTQNDYRKVCMISKPLQYGSTLPVTAPTADCCVTLVLDKNTVTGVFSVDSIVTGATSFAKGRVVDYVAPTGGSNGFVRLIRTDSENVNNPGASAAFQVGESVSSSVGSGVGTISSITQPNVKQYSGDIIYSEYRIPITRAEDQTEAIRAIIQF